MTYYPILTPKQEEELCEMWLDNIYTLNEISVTFKVSHRTVYRTLAKYQMPKRSKKTRKKRKPRAKGRVPLLPCGTEAAYRRHRRANEYPCGPCLEAHSAEVRKYSKSEPRELEPCGTEAAYKRHASYKEEPCQACKDARNKKKRERYAQARASNLAR